jgi:hypothetical protein
VRLGPATICPMRLTLVHFDAEQLRLTGHPPPPPAAAGCWLLAAGCCPAAQLTPPHRSGGPRSRARPADGGKRGR